MVSIKPGGAALTLFGAPGSSTTNRLRIALALKGIDYNFVSINIGDNECRSPEYLKTMNTLGQIPILQVNHDVKLRQSVAILEYLEEAYPSLPPLLPTHPLERARVRQVVEIVNSYIQPMQNKLTVEKIAEMDPALAEWLPQAVKAHVHGTKHKEPQVAPVLWPHWWIIKGFESIEGLIDKEPSQYCFGNQLTLADCALVPQVIGAKKYQVDMTPYPNICRVYDNVSSLEAVREGLGDVLSTV
jgi:maleylpyruvate isomerase